MFEGRVLIIKLHPRAPELVGVHRARYMMWLAHERLRQTDSNTKIDQQRWLRHRVRQFTVLGFVHSACLMMEVSMVVCEVLSKQRNVLMLSFTIHQSAA